MRILYSTVLYCAVLYEVGSYWLLAHSMLSEQRIHDMVIIHCTCVLLEKDCPFGIIESDELWV